jgi:endoribonuclease Dicer
MEESPLKNILEDEDETMNDSNVRIAKIKQDIYKTIKNWTFTLPNLDPSSKGFNVSPKIAKLVKIIQCFRHEGDSFRGILIGKLP